MTLSNTILLTIQTGAMVGVIHSVVCRAALMDANTARELRWAFVFLAATSLTVLLTPLMPLIWPEYFLGSGPLRWKPWQTPRSVYVLFGLSVCFVQVSARTLWDDAPPHQFQRG